MSNILKLGIGIALVAIASGAYIAGYYANHTVSCSLYPQVIPISQ